MKWTVRGRHVQIGSMTYSHSDCCSYGETGRAKSHGSKGSLQSTTEIHGQPELARGFLVYNSRFLPSILAMDVSKPTAKVIPEIIGIVFERSARKV